jgi:hypothetical protein
MPSRKRCPPLRSFAEIPAGRPLRPITGHPNPSLVNFEWSGENEGVTVGEPPLEDTAMFASKISKQQSKADEASTSRPKPYRPTLVGQEQESVAEHSPIETASGGVSWDFGKIGVLSPGPAGRARQAVMQTKLTVGSVNDPLEREADTVADRVVRMAEPGPMSTAAPKRLNRKCAACEEEDTQTLRTKSAGGNVAVGEAPAAVHDVLNSPGRALDAATRAFFEPRFGADFSTVRVHDDGRAADSANKVDALAYTVGHHIVFARNRLAPAAAAGRRLIAHELAHVVQQSGTSARTLRRQEKTVGGPLDLKVDPCVSPPGLGQICGQGAVKVCEEHPGLPGCSIVCKALGCTKKDEPKTRCKPGSRAATSSAFAGQCCVGTPESAQHCCPPERVAFNPVTRCCPEGTTVDPSTDTCIKTEDITSDCPPERKTTLGLCCFPPQVLSEGICTFPTTRGPQTPQPTTPTPGPQLGTLWTDTIHFQKDHPAPGESAGAPILTAEGQSELASVQRWLRLSPDLQVRLIGHASSEGDTDSNQQLSARRVQFVGATVAGRLSEPVLADALASGCTSVGTGLWACGERQADQVAANPEDRVVKVTFMRNQLPPLQAPQFPGPRKTP